MDEKVMQNGIDWAYARLVRKAHNGDRNQVRELAKLFKQEVLDACVGIACADLDWYDPKNRDAYALVKSVCIELSTPHYDYRMAAKERS